MLCQKLLTPFSQKSSIFFIVQIIWECSNFAYLWHKYLKNYGRCFRLPISAFAMITEKNPIRTWTFFKMLCSSPGVQALPCFCYCKSKNVFVLHNKYLFHWLVPLDYNWMIWTTQNLELLDEKLFTMLTILTNRWN